MAYTEVLYDVSDRVATVTLNRPDKLNAWTPTMEAEVQEAMLASDRDDDVRVIILTGAGRGFCAGADMGSLDTMAKTDDPLAAVDRLREKFVGPKLPGARPDFQKTYSYFPALTKPVIGAVNGAAAGLGFVISLYCDLRFASDKAKFSTAFARRGLIAEYGMSWMLPRIVGVANALDLLYSARLIDASEAARMGLVSRVIPQEQFESEVRAYAVELASACSPRSLRVMKRQVYDALFSSLGEAIDVAGEEMISEPAMRGFQRGRGPLPPEARSGLYGKVNVLKTDCCAPVLHIGIPNPMFEGELNLYVIAGDPLTLVDTGIGTPEALAALESGLAAHGLSIDAVRQVRADAQARRPHRAGRRRARALGCDRLHSRGRLGRRGRSRPPPRRVRAAGD